MYRSVRDNIELTVSASGKRWYRRVNDEADVEIDISINDSDYQLSQEVLRSCRVNHYPSHRPNAPGFKVMRWRMEGESGSHAIWVSNLSYGNPRFVESTRLLVIDEYKKIYGKIDCEPELTYHNVPKGKSEFMEWLNECCSK